MFYQVVYYRNEVGAVDLIKAWDAAGNEYVLAETAQEAALLFDKVDEFIGADPYGDELPYPEDMADYLIVSGREARVHKMPPSANRWKERSRTYTGIAAAMAEQWGGLDADVPAV